MSYEKCRECEFWVAKQENTACPNCGTFEPYVPKLEAESMTTTGCLLTLSVMLGGLVGGGYFGWEQFGLWGEIAGFLCGPVIGFIAGVIVAELTTEKKMKRFKERSPQFLLQDEQLIEQRLKELSASQEAIVQLQQRIEPEGGAGPWEDLRHMLQQATENLPEQRKKYQAGMWAIELVRWQNTLEPLKVEWNDLTNDECHRRLEALAAARGKGEEILRKWEGQSDLAEHSDGQVCLLRLRNVLAACEQLRQALIAQQAFLAVQAVTPLDSNLHPAFSPDRMDLLDSRVAVSEFSATFRELEGEYARLQSETEEVRRMQQFWAAPGER